jgi:hypothetical protein
MTMTVRLLVATTLTLVVAGARAQEATRVRPETLPQVNHLPWPHIGSPPAEGGPAAEAEHWRQEAATFERAFAAIKGSWTGKELTSADDLRTRVQQYEDLIRTVGGSPGYGNVLLADCLRRLSVTLVVEYAVGHPAENEVVDRLMRSDRVSLWDCDALHGMLSEELKLAAPLGGWRLLENRQQFESIFVAGGTTLDKEVHRTWLAMSSTSLMSRRDVYGLLFRLMETELVERVHLPGLIEFRRLGGRLEDLNADDSKTFTRVMERDRWRFKFPPAGVNVLGGEHLLQLKEDFDPHGKKVNAYTKRALE